MSTIKMPDYGLNSIKSKIRAEDEKKIRGLSFAKLYFANKDYEKALTYLNEYLTIKNNSAEAYKVLGDVYEALDNKEKSFEAYKKSYYIDKNQDNLLFKICEKLENLNTDTQTIKQWLDRLEKKYPNHQSVFTLKDKLQLENGNCASRLEDTFRDLSNVRLSDLTDDKCANLSCSFLNSKSPSLTPNQFKSLERTQDRLLKKVIEIEENFGKTSNQLLELVKENQTMFSQLMNEVEKINSTLGRLQLGQHELKETIEEYISGDYEQDEAAEEVTQDEQDAEETDENNPNNFSVSFLSCNSNQHNSDVFSRLGPTPQPSNQSLAKDNNTKPLSDLFKDQYKNKWECKSCYCKNEMTSTKCISCESPNPDSSPAKQPTLQPKSTPFSFTPMGGGGFTFNTINNTSENKFLFGVPPFTLPKTDTFVFGNQNIPSTNIASSPNKSFITSPKKIEEPILLNKKIDQKPTTGGGEDEPQIDFKSNIPLPPKVDVKTGEENEKIIFTNNTNENKFLFGVPPFALPTTGTFVFGNQNITSTNIASSSNKSFITSPKTIEEPILNKKIDQQPTTGDGEDEPQIDFKPTIPLPPKVDVITGEENEKIIFTNRAKLYRYVDNEWKERGLGDLKILYDENKNRYRFLMRREQIHKVCLNAAILENFEFMTTSLNKNGNILNFSCVDFSEEKPKPEILLVRFKAKETADRFKEEVYKILKILGGKVPEVSSIEANNKITTKEDKQKVIPKLTEYDDLEIVFVKEPKSNEEKEKAEKLKLPINFFSYENAKKCSGCNGCKDHIPKLRYESENYEDKENNLKEEEVHQTGVVSENFFSSAIADVGSTRSSWTKPIGQPKWLNSSLEPIFSKNQTANNENDDPEAEVLTLDFKPLIPLPDLVEVKTGEEDEEVLFSQRSKLYKYSNNEWKERGIGDFKVLMHKQTKKLRFLMRREQVHKICLNHLVDKNLKISKRPLRENIYQWSATDFSESIIGEPSNFNIKFKNKEIGNEFIEILKKNIDEFEAIN